MKKTKTILLALLLFFTSAAVSAQVTLIPMDEAQSDHLKAYGIAFKALEMGKKVEWLLNYRAGSFVIDSDPEIARLCLIQIGRAHV